MKHEDKLIEENLHFAKMLSTKEAAELLSLTAKTLSRLRATGEGPKYVPISKTCVRYFRADVVNWMQSKAIRSTYELGRGVTCKRR